MSVQARADDAGNCYGGGTPGDAISDGLFPTGVCSECGRRIGLVHGSQNRLTHHKPVDPRPAKVEGAGNKEHFARIASRINVAAWLGEERRKYADKKYAEDSEARHKLVLETKDYGYSGEWEVFATNYLSRVKLFGVDTAAGRQALGKAVVTLMHCLETSVQVHGAMPEPGLPSGEVREWIRD